MNTTLTTNIPCNIEAECAVLGAILIDSSAISKVSFLTTEMFYDSRNRRIFEVAKKLFSKSKGIDIISVKTLLGKEEIFQGNEVPYLTSLTYSVVTSVNILEHAKIIKALWQKRQLLNIVHEVENETSDYGISPEESIDNLLDKIAKISNTCSSFEEKMSDAKDQMMERIRKAIHGETLGALTGFPEIDNGCGGFSYGDLITIGAETSVGKSAFAWTVAVNIASNDVPIGFFTLEMLPYQLFGRNISHITGINSARITNPSPYGKRALTDSEIRSIEEAAKESENLPIYFSQNRTIESICAQAKQWIIRYQIKGIFIDFLQILANEKANINETTFLTSVVVKLQQLAKENNIFICLLSQLSRPGVGVSNMPTLQRLRGSHGIATASDMVILISRPEQDRTMYPSPFENISIKGTALIDIQKGRNVGTSKFMVKFDAETTTFRSFDGPLPQTEDEPSRPLISYNDVFSSIP